MTRTQVLVAEPVRILRTGIVNLLQRESDFDVLEAASLEEVEELALAHSPDVALVDLDLPPVGGMPAVSLLARETSSVTIVWSFKPSREGVLAAIRAGAHGYLHKEISQTGLVRALRRVTHGEAPLARDIAALMIEAMHGQEQRASAQRRFAGLSGRERQVLGLVAQGAKNRDIADDLAISEFTVKRHVQNILQKLGLSSRRQAAEFYRSAFDADRLPQAVSQTA